MKNLFGAGAALIGLWFLINLIGATIVGALARRLLPGKDQVGWFMTILIGFLGGMIGKAVAWFCGYRQLGWFGGFVVSVLGAIGLLVLHRIWSAVKKNPTAATSPKP